MGFCEMAYHETRNFPDAEKDGLAKELRTTAMLLLRTITRDSVKSQKDFLNALDKTIEIQLDILLLLKLAFRMGFIDQGVYQTMEEDLKGLENISKEMKGMHGMHVSSDSIFDKLQPESKPEKKPVKKPKAQVSSSKQKEKEKPKEARPAKQPASRSRRGRSTQAKPAKVPMETQQKQNPQKLPDAKKPEKFSLAASIALDDFKGTPLYDDIDDMPPDTNEASDSTQPDSVTQKEDTKSVEPDEKETPKKSTPKKAGRSRWSLKRSTSRKPSGKSKPGKK